MEEDEVESMDNPDQYGVVNVEVLVEE